MCKHAVKNLPYLLIYVFDRSKTKKKCTKAILENCGTLMFVPDHYENQEMCNKSLPSYITLLH